MSEKEPEKMRTVLILVVTFLSCGFADAVGSEKRVALIVGNAGYREAGRLLNTLNDASDLAAKLGELEFDVTLKVELGLEEFDAVVDEFIEKAQGAKVALFYYAGHAIQLEETNYLVPIDAELQNERVIPRQTKPAQYIVERMEGAAAISLVFLDACRNNPLADRLRRNQRSSTRSVSLGRGLARVDDRGRDTLIVYSTEPGRIAEDGAGTRNSPFMAGLLKHIDSPGLEVEVMLKRVTATVLEVTAKKQHPQRLSKLVSEFYFKPASSRHEAPPPRAALLRAESDQRDRRSLTLADERRLKPADIFKECDLCPEMILLPRGEFEMGAKEEANEKGEKPERVVTIARGLSVSKFEITVRQFEAFLNATARDGRLNERWFASGPQQVGSSIVLTGEGARSQFVAKTERHEFPVTYVSWYGADAYAHWLSSRTGSTYRLLSEAEWEYAARAKSKSIYHFGDDPRQLCNYANIADISGQKAHRWSPVTDCDDGYADLAPVGRFQPNAFGLHDMLGNAAEWVADCWHPTYDNAPSDGSAWIVGGNCSQRMVRGGSFYNLWHAVRSSKRYSNAIYTKFDTIGFRVARPLRD